MPSPHAPPAERPLPHHAAVPTTLTLNAIAFFLPARRSGVASDTPKGKVTPPHPGPGAAANASSRPKASSMRRKRSSISVNCTALWCSLTNHASFSASPGVTSPRPASASREDKTRGASAFVSRGGRARSTGASRQGGTSRSRHRRRAVTSPDRASSTALRVSPSASPLSSARAACGGCRPSCRPDCRYSRGRIARPVLGLH
jgi:hypothetical protein